MVEMAEIDHKRMLIDQQLALDFRQFRTISETVPIL
jgi:hypothetical protein